MKEKPILFNTEMVKAIIDGWKTQSRRPFTKTNKRDFALASQLGEVSNFMENGIKGNDLSYIKDLSPYQIGDKLYVRETFRPHSCFSGSYCGNGIEYKADGFKKEFVGDVKYGVNEVKSMRWKPSIHMPKEYARIWLEITDIRVERIQGITEEQAKSEGITTDHILEAVYKLKNPLPDSPFVGGFAQLWNSIYSNWTDNPWVWVIEFKRIDKNGSVK